MKLRTVGDASQLAGKRVLFRADFNVPIENGEISDDGRIRAAVPTLRKLIDVGCQIVVCSHLGRPDGKPDPEFTLAPIAARLEQLLGQPVAFAADTVGVEARGMAKALADGGVGIVENLRFVADETSAKASERLAFATKLSELAECFVNDAFGVVHRAQASVVEVAELLPSWAGDLIASEVEVLERLVTTPERPYTLVLGGAKVSDKLAVISHLLPKVDRLLIGGGMVFTVLAASGKRIGKSLYQEDAVPAVNQFLEEAKRLGVQIELPADIRIASEFSATADVLTVPADQIESSSLGANAIGLDIGPDSARSFARLIESSKTVFWNGPMGVFEFPNFAQGTRAVAEALTKVAGLAVVGGGDSASAIRALGFRDEQFGHVSTGGGASLEFLEGKSLPGLEPLYEH